MEFFDNFAQRCRFNFGIILTNIKCISSVLSATKTRFLQKKVQNNTYV